MNDLKPDVAGAVTELVEPALLDEGFELVEVQYRREDGGWKLRLFIDRIPEGDTVEEDDPKIYRSGVTLGDCAAVSREIGSLLEMEEIVPGAYNLEISSPGLARPLVKPGDFDRFSGYKVQVRLKEPISGKRKIKGLLTGNSKDSISLDVEGEPLTLSFETIKRVNLDPQIDWSR